MPNMDGVSSTTRIRQFDTTTPIIAMTSNTSQADCMTYLAHRMNDILAKPFAKEALWNMLERYCEHLKAPEEGSNGVATTSAATGGGPQQPEAHLLPATSPHSLPGMPPNRPYNDFQPQQQAYDRGWPGPPPAGYPYPQQPPQARNGAYFNGGHYLPSTPGHVGPGQYPSPMQPRFEDEGYVGQRGKVE